MSQDPHMLAVLMDIKAAVGRLEKGQENNLAYTQAVSRDHRECRAEFQNHLRDSQAHVTTELMALPAKFSMHAEDNEAHGAAAVNQAGGRWATWIPVICTIICTILAYSSLRRTNENPPAAAASVAPVAPARAGHP